MHRCWTIPELTRLITEQLDPRRRKTDRPALAALARTCRALLDPSLDVLWRHQDTFARLVWLLPEDAIRFVMPDAEWKHCFMLINTRPLLPIDWSRFNFYAPRVKSVGAINWLPLNSASDSPYHHTLEVAQSSVLTLSESIYEAFKEHLPCPILPHLQELQWVVPGILFDNFHYVQLFLTPVMKRLYLAIEWPEDQEEYGDFLIEIIGVLPRCCPYLQELHLFNGNPFVSEALGEIVSQLVNLRSIAFWYMGDQLENLLDKLRELPHLRSLHLRGSEDLVVPAGIGKAFTLHRLTLDCMKYGAIMDLLSFMQPGPLKYLKVEFYDIPRSDEVRDFLVSIRDSLADTLEHVDFSTHDDSIENSIDPDRPITLETLHPLLDMPKLHTLKTFTGNTWDLDDFAIKKTVDAWPLLRVLDFETGIWRLPKVMTTLDSVMYIAQNCQHLESFSLSFNAYDIPALDPVIHLPGNYTTYEIRRPRRPEGLTTVYNECGLNSHTGVKEVNIGESKYQNRAALTLFLLKCFPNLEAIEGRLPAEAMGVVVENDEDEGMDDMAEEDGDGEDMDEGVEQEGPVMVQYEPDGGNTVQHNQVQREWESHETVPWSDYLKDFKGRIIQDFQFAYIG
ncbi:hypothetical protein OBBRIDRAFT_822380 [Obba rivulosa]|uniref:F-box domain-containing protein n=1 Tax=Obba rivulosa TaxID=1052685 RepID=A0A8E2DV35_9APHY|nr:hypothetical protein OBBRIDRAFT_822380 [Obba rivulosa]